MALLNNALLSTNTSRPLVYASLPLVSASLPLVNSTGLVLAQLVPFNAALLLPPNPSLALLFAARVWLALVCWAVFLLVLSSAVVQDPGTYLATPTLEKGSVAGVSRFRQCSGRLPHVLYPLPVSLPLFGMNSVELVAWVPGPR